MATVDARLPCRIQVSTVFDILTHKGRAQPVTGQAPPQTQSEEGISLCPLAQDVERLASLLVADGLVDDGLAETTQEHGTDLSVV